MSALLYKYRSKKELVLITLAAMLFPGILVLEKILAVHLYCLLHLLFLYMHQLEDSNMQACCQQLVLPERYCHILLFHMFV